LVRDQALGLGKHQLELFWHIDPELVPTGENKNTFRSADANLLILTPQNHGWLEEIKTENWSPAYGRQESHTTL
jgi:hypothetical protein